MGARCGVNTVLLATVEEDEDPNHTDVVLSGAMKTDTRNGYNEEINDAGEKLELEDLDGTDFDTKICSKRRKKKQRRPYPKGLHLNERNMGITISPNLKAIGTVWRQRIMQKVIGIL